MSEGTPQLDEITAAWHQARDAYAESERRYQNLVEHSLGLICTHDLSGRLLSINPAAARSLGYEPEHGVGSNLADFLDPDTRHLFDGYLQRIREKGHDAGLMRVVSRDGTPRVWMYRNVLFGQPAGEPYVLGHALDITERVVAERTLRENEQALRAAHDDLDRRVQERTLALQEANERLRVEIAERQRAEEHRERALAEAHEANRLKDEFLGTLSHELRTPLSVVSGWARILRTRPLDRQTAHAVEVIERNAQAQIRLIEDLLDVSRIITGKMTLAMEPVNLRNVLGAAIESVRPALQAKGIQLATHLDEDIGSYRADPHRLQQVFWNVLSNALKFTDVDGAITVRLRRSGAWVETEISDTGIGIEPDVLPFVFDRFRQADSSTTRTHGGLGLGLAIVRHIVELHGGAVAAHSDGAGRGATFTIKLPIARGDHIATAVRASDSSLVAQSPVSQILRGRTILIVEDHDDTRELVASLLSEAGAHVIGAASAAEALAAITGARPDLVVADLGLPGEDGYALLDAIRTLAVPWAKRVPAVALTGYARPADRDRALAAGFLHYIVKPVDPVELITLLASAIADPR